MSTIYDRLMACNFTLAHIQQAVRARAAAVGYDVTLELALDWLCLHLSTQDLPPLFTEGHMRAFHNNQNNHAATTATPLVLVAPTSTSTSTSEATSTLQQQRQEDLATTPSFYQSKETAVPIEEDEQEKAAHRALVAMCSCACA
jgi:hypothetical protein